MQQKKQSVLLVDDEAVVRDSLSEWLSDDGYDVGIADDGEKALKMLKDRPFDTAVVDLKMPGMDGLEVLNRVKQEHPLTNIIIITAYGSVENAVEAMKNGAHDFLCKPVTADHLEKAIESCHTSSLAELTETKEPSKIGKVAIPSIPKTKIKPAGKEIPTKPREKEKLCIWAKAGVVSYRICTNNFQCDFCEFGQTMMDQGAEAGDRPMMMDAIKKLLEKPGQQRACRYMLSGDVAYKLCPNLYQCNKCAFNEQMQDALEKEAEKITLRLKKRIARRQSK